MKIGRIIAVLCCVFFLASDVSAKSVSGYDFPDTLTVDGVKLNLNGAGIRKKFTFVKAYAAGLYLQKASSNAQAIVDADEVMAVVMIWIKNGTTREKLGAGWTEGFARVMKNGDITPLKSEIDRFNACIPDELKTGDTFRFEYVPAKGLVVYFNNVEKDAIQGMAFKKALFEQWLGPNPPDGSLKKLKKSMLDQ